MLALFLLNVLGFYGIFLGLQFRMAQVVNEQLDQNNYSESDAVTFRIPVTMPYAVYNADYERVTGEFEHDGETFRLLKQRLYNDTLFVVCVKDHESKKINEAIADFVKTFSDKSSSSKQQNQKLELPTFSKDYLTTGVAVQRHTSGWRNQASYGRYIETYTSCYCLNFKIPPRPISLS